jgi:hypothetical protein
MVAILRFSPPNDRERKQDDSGHEPNVMTLGNRGPGGFVRDLDPLRLTRTMGTWPCVPTLDVSPSAAHPTVTGVSSRIAGGDLRDHT